MLEPERRSLLLDGIRPPDGYALDQAIGTTYSLDLNALLLAPLSFALFDWAEDEQPNVIALLEAVRRCADDITVFCQAGQVSLPKDYQPLLVYLEPRVLPVVPPNPDLIFHPKVWALRFTAEDDGPDLARLLVLSRNLTFDRSWDTVLRLDGELGATGDATVRDRNAPLAEFLRSLPRLATRPVPADERGRVERFADELLDVDWDLPEGFSELAFVPLGIDETPWPLPRSDRTLVVSPFITAGTLKRIAATGDDHVLVSRNESLDDVGSNGLGGYGETYVLTTAAWQELTEESDASEDGHSDAPDEPGTVRESVAEAAGNRLTGLHAKLYVCERGGSVEVLTGSANATDAAFNGNVEFLVRLRSDHGPSIEDLLTHEKDRTVFRDLLESYRPAHGDPLEISAEEAIAADLDRLRRAVGALRFCAEISPLEGAEPPADEYRLQLHADRRGLDAIEGELSELQGWPITVGGGHAKTLQRTETGLAADFGKVARRSLTSFFAIRIAVEAHGLRDEQRFVVNAELVGAPGDRRERVIVDMIDSQDRLLRYLLFLLSEGGIETREILEEMEASSRSGSTGEGTFDFRAPLFESLVRALARDPGRLDHIARLVDDLRRTEETRELIPAELDAVWDPIWQARQELSR